MTFCPAHIFYNVIIIECINLTRSVITSDDNSPLQKPYTMVSCLHDLSMIGIHTSMEAIPGRVVASRYPIFCAMRGIPMMPTVSRMTLCRNETALAIT